ncbi:MAG: 6-carboxytetrahydropterin synthase [Phycisphaerales bacterium]|jgi:6-pyruvoyl-tetrahydropterin synthase|nr:6-carboxytetrahydropterin synthase [Phycisphaerales bacterium]
MFDVSVSSSFDATHAVTIAGVEEPQHNHKWKVVIVISGNTLDCDEVLVDFIELQKQLETIISPLRDSNLNTCHVLNGKNPTAEIVAKYIATELRDRIESPLLLSSVTITEAPNCTATFKP